ncbi:MAG: DNA-directed RNA polymerase subunit omega [Sedimentisphaerales bacterium]|nr:DNA-directed RNA polymerase subunit omega [Sedimentisphaerales bacterium]
MIEALKSDDIVNKVGGKFRLTALIQRRMKELIDGARPLIDDVHGKNMVEIVIQEIVENKIEIDYDRSPDLERPVADANTAKAMELSSGLRSAT